MPRPWIRQRAPDRVAESSYRNGTSDREGDVRRRSVTGVTRPGMPPTGEGNPRLLPLSQHAIKG